MEKVHTLVVDDEPGIRFFVEETLHRSGHDVTTVKSGEEALESLRETPFDLVILDLKLSGRVDGIKVLEAIRSNTDPHVHKEFDRLRPDQ